MDLIKHEQYKVIHGQHKENAIWWFVIHENGKNGWIPVQCVKKIHDESQM